VFLARIATALVATALIATVPVATGSAAAAERGEPRAVPAPLLEGAEQRVRERLDSLYRRVLERPSDAATWGAYAMALEAHRQLEAAAESYRRAGELAPEDFRWQYLLAALLDYSAPDQAVALYARAVRLRPDYAPARVRYGETLERLGRRDEARDQFARAAALDPGNPLGPFGLGRVALAEGEVEEAVRQLRTASTLDPSTQAIVATLARALFRGGDEEGARRAAEEARGLPKMAHHPDPVRAEVQAQAVDSESYLFRSRRLQEVGQLDAALAELVELLRLEPENASGHLALAGLYDRMGRAAAALAAVDRALDLDPDLAGAPSVRASALFKLGRADEAERAAQSALARSPDDFHMLLLLALIDAQRGAVNEHMAHLDRAYRVRTADTQLRRLLRQLLLDLGDALASAGERGLAAERFREVLTLMREDRAPPSEQREVAVRLEAASR
jgi:tetratricopeptide (TPR) repeat protein